MKSYSKDPVIKFNYNPVLNSVLTPLNAVGATTSLTLRTLDFTPSDSNTIFVAKTGLDTNAGTSALPVLTVMHAVSLMTTGKSHIVIKDSGVYAEVGGTISDCEGIYAAIGQAPTIEPISVAYDNYVIDQVMAETKKNTVSLARTDGVYNSGAPESSANTEIIELSDGNTAVVYSYYARFLRASPHILEELFNSWTGITVIGKSGTSISSEILFNSLKNSKGCALDNGYFIVAGTYSIGTQSGHSQEVDPDFDDYTDIHYSVYSNDGSLVYSKTSGIGNGKVLAVCPQYSTVYNYDENGVLVSTDNFAGRFLIVYLDGSNVLHGIIEDYTTTTKVAVFTITPYVGHFVDAEYDCVSMSDGGFVLCGWNYYNSSQLQPVYNKISKGGAVSHSAPVTFTMNNAYALSVKCCLGNTETEVVFAVSYVDSVYFYKVDISDYSITTTPTPSINIGNSYTCIPYSLTHTRDGVFVGSVLVLNGGTVVSLYLYFFKIDWTTYPYTTIISTKTMSTIDSKFVCCYNLTYDRLFLAGLYLTGTSNGISSYDVYVKIFGGFVWDWLTLSDTIELNGLILDNTLDNLRKYISSSASSGSLTFKWCNLQNIKRTLYGDEETYPCQPLVSTALHNVFENCKVAYNHGGFNFTSNNVKIEYTQFIKILKDYSVSITGYGDTNESIKINHCDFVRSYGGIELLSNNGNEIIKNSIFYSITNYTIKSDVAIDFSYCVNPGIWSSLVSVGLSVIQSNPLYVNDGSLSELLINLNLKQKLLGYLFDSPAIGLADDLGNCGALIVDLGDSTQTWDDITVTKPLINLVNAPVGAVRTDFKDGSVKAYRDAYQEEVTMTWEGISLSDRELLELMYLLNNSTVRIYPDPTTYPNNYDGYDLIFNSIKTSPKTSNKFSEVGSEDLVLVFVRAYSLSS